MVPDQAGHEAVLRRVVRDAGSLLVAFSGGVDSALLVRVARDELGMRAKAFTAAGAALPLRELEDCRRLALEIGIEHVVERSNEIEDPNYVANPVNRCYYCKTELYTLARRVADGHGLDRVAAGINRDDLGDHRPGIEAARFHGVLMPFVDAGMGKPEIRSMAARLGLSAAQKPAAACLASRIPYGTPIVESQLRRVEQCENFLKDLGFAVCRVRHFGTEARIEVPVAGLPAVAARSAEIVTFFSLAGFTNVTLDLAGYRTGSLNRRIVRETT